MRIKLLLLSILIGASVFTQAQKSSVLNTRPEISATYLQKLPSDYSGLQFWHNSSSLTGFVDNDLITTIPDLSGNGRHLNQSSGGRKAFYDVSIQNGLPSIHFSGGQNYEWQNGKSDTNFLHQGSSTFIIVIKSTTSAGQQYLFDDATTSAAKIGRSISITNNAGVNALLDVASNGSAFVFGGTSKSGKIPHDQPHIIVLRYEGGLSGNDYEGHVDNVLQISSENLAALSGSASTEIPMAFADAILGNYFIGHFFEWAAWNRRLSDAEVNELIGSSTYGIVGNDPINPGGLRSKYKLTNVRSVPSFVSNGKVLIPGAEYVLEHNTVPGTDDYYAFPVIAERIGGNSDVIHLLYGRAESHSIRGANGGSYIRTSTDGFATATAASKITSLDPYGTGSIGVLPSGRLVVDAQEYIGATVTKILTWSDDGGSTWSPIERFTTDYFGGLIDGPSRPISYDGKAIKSFYAQPSPGSYGSVVYEYLDNGETRAQIGIINPIDDPANFEETCIDTFSDNLALAISRSDDLALNGAYRFWSSDAINWSSRKFAFPSIGKSPILITPNQTAVSLGRLALKRDGTVGLDNVAKKTAIFATSPDRGETWEWYPLDTRDGGYVYADAYYHTGLNKVVSIHSVEKGATGSTLEGADLIVRHYTEMDESTVASTIATITSGYCAEAAAVVNIAYRAGFTLPSQSKLDAWNTFVTYLVSSGILTTSDFTHVFEFNDANVQDFGCLNIKNPRAYQATRYSATGSTTYPNYSALGFEGNKINNYINLNWDPTLNAVNYTLNNCNITVGISEASSAGVEIGSYKTAGGTVLSQIGTFAEFYILNSGIPSTITTPVKTGLFSLNRYTSTSVQLFRNGSSLGTSSQVSVSIPAGEWVLGARATETIVTNNRVYDQFCDSRIEFVRVGSSMDASTNSGLATAWAAYKTAIGL